jgi:eukaryotic-like serine/threonine-protein kinase
MSVDDPFIGREILDGQFKLLQKIGAGGMGTVYKALQPEMNRHVAVKLLHPKLTDRKDIVSRFGREARALSHLTHPNTVRVLLYGELDDGVLYIVMEYLEGKNLHQIVKREGPMPLSRVIPIIVQACGALEEAHKAGIIHRDLKPENIFVSVQGGLKDFAKVLDFGLAKVTDKEMGRGSVMLTQKGMIFGTPEFMSPEQAQGKELTPASDVYSVATILFEALTGKLPFEAKNAMEFLQMQVSAPPAKLNEVGFATKFPKELEDIIERALLKAPERRQASTEEFGAELMEVYQTYKRDVPSLRVPVGGNASAAPLPALPQPPEVSLPAAPLPANAPANASGNKLWIAIVVSFVLGIIATLILVKALASP